MSRGHVWPTWQDNAVNYAYLRSIGIMLGQNLIRDYTDSTIVAMGKRLVEPRGIDRSSRPLFDALLSALRVRSSETLSRHHQ